MLRRLLVGRLAFTPRVDENGQYYEFAGQRSISQLLSGVVLPKVWWPQRDSNPCFSHDHVFAMFRYYLSAEAAQGISAIETRRMPAHRPTG